MIQLLIGLGNTTGGTAGSIMEKSVIPFGFIFACLHTSIVASKFVSTMDESSSSGVRFNRVV